VAKSITRENINGKDIRKMLDNQWINVHPLDFIR
jgi:hypothetical protein